MVAKPWTIRPSRDARRGHHPAAYVVRVPTTTGPNPNYSDSCSEALHYGGHFGRREQKRSVRGQALLLAEQLARRPLDTRHLLLSLIVGRMAVTSPSWPD